MYRYHFDNLKNYIDSGDRASYESLRNKLYYNNELYKRIYENFEFIKHKKEVVNKDETLKHDFDTKLFGSDASVSLKGKNSINISNSSGTLAETFSKKAQEFICFTVSRKLIFCSTTDNLILVFNNKLERVDTISMGARVTALDVFDDGVRTIIYFGTTNGYIGYINYDVYKKRQQPVFENKLETEITAIQLFGQSFLLAAGRASSPKVYKLDNNSLTPDKLLFGNELPYNKSDYGEITNAAYIPEVNRVMLVTSKGTYSWNPFTAELLDKLKEPGNANFDLQSPVTLKLINATQFY